MRAKAQTEKNKNKIQTVSNTKTQHYNRKTPGLWQFK